MAEENFRVQEILPTADRHTGTVIFLHGACDTGGGLELWVSSTLDATMEFPHLKVIYPTAPRRPYTADQGIVNTVWFDWPSIHPSLQEDLESIDPICVRLRALVQQQIDQGIPPNRIILGGLSMGGLAALHLAYRHLSDVPVAGVFAMSAFLNDGSKVFSALSENKDKNGKPPPLFMSHGKVDQLIQHEWGKTAFDQLQDAGIQGEFHSYDKLTHSMSKPELEALMEWIIKVLPDK